MGLLGAPDLQQGEEITAEGTAGGGQQGVKPPVLHWLSSSCSGDFILYLWAGLLSIGDI